MKIEAALISYGLFLLVSGTVQTVAPDHVDLFIPAVLGAIIASLRTIRKAVSKEASSAPTTIGLSAAISMTSGFSVSYYGTTYMVGWISQVIRPPEALAAIVIAAGGEFALSLLLERWRKASGDRSQHGDQQ